MVLFNNFKEAISTILQCQFLLHSHYNEHNSKSDHDSNEFTAESLKSIRDVQHLKNIRMRNMNRIIIGHLNVNSLKNKFESLQEQINGNVDILLISETKLDNSFPNGQFMIREYSAPYKIDRDTQGGAIMLFIRDDIPSKLLVAGDSPNESFTLRKIYVKSNGYLIAKLHGYGFSLNALRLVHSYLTNSKQGNKSNTKYSFWEGILFRVAQGSIVGTLLFNIFLFNLFFIMNETEFASYADGNAPYTSGQNIDDVIRTLQNDSVRLFKFK